MEGRALLYNPVLGADQPRPLVSPCSPSEDSNKCNKPVYSTSESMQEFKPNMTGCAEEERLWPSNPVCSGLLGQTECGRHLHLIYLYFCTMIFCGDWTSGHYGCCEQHRKAANDLSRATCIFFPSKPEQTGSCYQTPAELWLAPPRLTWHVEVDFEPHLPCNIEKDGPAWLGLGTVWLRITFC